MLTAALHLDLIREKYPSFQLQMGPQVSDQPETLRERIAGLQKSVGERMEQIQSIKCEFLDE